MNAARSVVMGTAGHIDHGKTSLVMALTGTDTDRLPEEKARGITIDLGFAALPLTDAEGMTLDLSLVDVPGHHAFIRNMLAGTGGIDSVLLVVAADEGVKAQTAEHLVICSLLGVRCGVIALTKRDAVSVERLEQARDEIRRLVKKTFLETAPLIAVSALTGEGLDDLKRALLQVALNIPEHSTDATLRLPLDRAFSIPGFGTVVTGTLHDGSVRQGDGVELQPGGRPLRVRGIQVHHQSVKEAHAPTRVALNLAGIEVGEVVRGDTIVGPGTLSPVNTVDVELTVLESARPLKHRSQLGIHAFTSESVARLLLYDLDDEKEKGTRLARLRLSKPMLLAPGDHFVLRQRSPAEIMGGGRVLDAHPMPRWRKSAVRQWLMQIRDASPGQQILARVRRRGVQGISLAALAKETGLQKNAIRRLTTPLIAANQVIGDENGVLQPEALNDAVEFLFREVTQKDSKSISRAELHSKARLQDWVFDLAMKQLVQIKPVRMVGTQISRNEISSAAAQQAEVLAKVEEIYRAAGLGSPLVSEVASTLQVPQKDLPPLITLLVRSGKLVRMGADNLLIHADALAKLKVELMKQPGQTFDVGRFKALTGLTRKHAIPLLEYLDRSHVTVNSQGIRRVL
jgi:selenocysteine-specific elongation factor